MRNDTRNDQRFIESGAAAMQLAGLDRQTSHFDVIVIGGGQAGLSVGYHLKQRGLRFVILDAHARVGDAWRKRWDSLRLFSPASLDSLDGLPFPAPRDYFPTKDEMADYLESYAAHFQLPVRTGLKVEKLSREHGRFHVQAGTMQLTADQVVIAMASFQKKRVPDLARQLRSDIFQMHSSEYRNPSQLRDGAALIVGGGNSGAEIAIELSRTHAVRMVGRQVGEVPVRHGGWFGRLIFMRFLMRVVFHRILTINTPIGRKARPTMMFKATPLIRTKAAELARAGVERAPLRIVGVRDGLPALEDGRTLDVQNIVWCTGYEAGQSWIDLPIFDAEGIPQHEAGVVSSAPGLYFVGLPFLYSMSSAMVHGVGRDAKRIAGVVAGRAQVADAAVHAAPQNAALA